MENFFNKFLTENQTDLTFSILQCNNNNDTMITNNISIITSTLVGLAMIICSTFCILLNYFVIKVFLIFIKILICRNDCIVIKKFYFNCYN